MTVLWQIYDKKCHASDKNNHVMTKQRKLWQNIHVMTKKYMLWQKQLCYDKVESIYAIIITHKTWQLYFWRIKYGFVIEEK